MSAEMGPDLQQAFQPSEPRHWAKGFRLAPVPEVVSLSESPRGQLPECAHT